MSRLNRDLFEPLNSGVSNRLGENNLRPSIARRGLPISPNFSFYQNLLEDANDIIYSHDLAGNYISVNTAAERLTGYSREELLRMNIKQTVDPACLDLVQRMISRKISSEATQTSYEVDCVAKDGHKFTLDVFTRSIYSDGEPVAVQGIARTSPNGSKPSKRCRKQIRHCVRSSPP